MTDHKALLAEARLYDNTGGLMGAPGSPNATLCDLLRRLAAALEDATKPKIIPGMEFVGEIEDGSAWTMLANGTVLVTHPERLAYMMRRNAAGVWEKSVIQLAVEPWPDDTARSAMEALEK